MKFSEKAQTIHRTFNTVCNVLVVSMFLTMAAPIKERIEEINDDLTGLTDKRITQSEIAQIASDEGYRPCVYKDSLGLSTVGFGTLVEGDMKSGECIDAHEAVELLREHYEYHKASVERKYPWAEDKVKLVLINLSYNMGEGRLAGFENTLKHLENKEYDLAAGELLDSRYARQVPNRAGRMAGRIMELTE